MLGEPAFGVVQKDVQSRSHRASMVFLLTQRVLDDNGSEITIIREHQLADEPPFFRFT